MSVVFDIVIAFVVLVIAVVVIKYALILGAAVLAVLWNGVVILLRNRWITAFFLWEALSLFPPTAPYVLGFEGNFAPSLRGILPWQIMMSLGRLLLCHPSVERQKKAAETDYQESEENLPRKRGNHRRRKDNAFIY